MTIIRVSFAGHVKRAEHRQAGAKPVVEFSLCRKNKTKDGEPEAFTWIRVTLWEPPEWMAAKIIKGAFIAGSGDAILRTYTDKNGAKAQSLDVRCGSFDVDMPDERQQTVGAPEPAPAPTRPSAPVGGASGGMDEPPFKSLSEFELG